MKKYVNPDMKVSMFDVEKISATDATVTELTWGFLLSMPVYNSDIQNKIDSAQKSVSANVSFQDAIKFK